MLHSTILFTFLIALAVAVFFILSIIDLARKRRLFDDNNHLKRHAEKVCSLGGVAIFSAFWISFSLMAREGLNSRYCFLFAGSFMLFLVGVKDDLTGVTALSRLILQIGIASLLFFTGLKITSLPGLGVDLSAWGSYLLTVVLMAAIINAYNFIDGINGLASGLAFISSLAFGGVFYEAGAMNEVMISIGLAGSVLGFWFFNFGNAKIFMGDNGSTFIGIMFTYLTITFLSPSIQKGLEGAISPFIAGAILLIPMADMVKVVLFRILRGGSPFRGDHTHIHHILKKTGAGHRTICLILYGWNVLVIIFSLFLLPQDFYLANTSLLLVAGLPYLGIILSERIFKESKTNSFEASGTREFS